MNSRWYIGALVVLLTLLGVVTNQKQTPNQEIVLQFASEVVTSNETQSAVAIVRKQLQSAGVDDIYISKQDEGRLKITYYSNTDVSNIKRILLTDGSLVLGCVSTHENHQPIDPSSEDIPVKFNLDIYEIQEGKNSASSSAGKFALELKSENNRFVNPNVHFSFDDLVLKNDGIVKVSYNFQNNVVLVNGTKPHQIPEVRAGPLTNGIVS
jgi:preprotein translocase subunit SecD